MQFSDPLAFEEHLAPVGGEVSIRPMSGSRFRAGIDVRPMQRVALFTVDADSFLARKAQQDEFYALNIPFAPYVISESGTDRHYGHTDAYLLLPGHPFTFKCREKCHAMSCSIFVDPVNGYRERVLQDTVSGELDVDSQVSLMSASGNMMFRSAIKAWIAMGKSEFAPGEIGLREMEDDILASLLMMSRETTADEQRVALASERAIREIEDYICANLDTAITRDDLADVTGVPIRSLSRAFQKKHGVGPMAFVRQRRFDACYRHLHGSDRSATTVTTVAMSYGFEHLGKFAVAYKKAFGESPSQTLLA